MEHIKAVHMKIKDKTPIISLQMGVSSPAYSQI